MCVCVYGLSGIGAYMYIVCKLNDWDLAIEDKLVLKGVVPVIIY